MSFFFPVEAQPSWEGYTFVVPAVSVGNVGQLAADLVISTLQMNKAGIIYDDSITPVVGNDPYGGCFSSRVSKLHLATENGVSSPSPSTLMTSCELYESPPHRLVVLQLRSPLIRGRHASFRKKLIDFIKEKRFGRVLLLGSTHAHERIDAQLHGDQFRFVATSSFSTKSNFGDALSKLSWTELEKRENREENCVKDVNPYLPGGGISKQLILACERESIPALALIVFCSEGDNVPESFLLVNRLNDLANIVEGQKPNWSIPGSWSALFGNPAENELVFG